MACATLTPSRRRAMLCWLWFSRTARSASVRASGTQMSREVGNHEPEVNQAGMTPITV